MTSVLEPTIVSYVSTDDVEKSCEQAITAVEGATKDSPLIVDLDETLFLRNVTQEYLGSIYPRPVGAAFLSGVKALKPWRWLPASLGPADVTRDWLLVLAATIVFPWTLLVWRWRAKKLAELHCNRSLAAAIDNNPSVQLVIMTYGCDLIVNPLIRHLSLVPVKNNNFQVICARFWQWKANNFPGRLEMVSAVLGEAAVASSVVITDSEDDLPLLESSAVPCLLKWPGAAFVPAMADMYIPLLYSEKVKNPGKAHFVKRVIFGHWVFGVIAWSVLSPHPLLNAVSLLLLTLSYWCVYEIGYQENDAVGEKYENKPTLSSAYEQYKSRIDLSTPWPWCWAIALAVPGIFLFVMSQEAMSLAEVSVALMGVLDGMGQSKPVMAWSTVEGTIVRDFIAWMAYLVAIRATFWVYNRANETSRIWIYPFLQVQRLFGFALLASTSAVGVMLMMAFVIARWTQYCVYRCGGDRSSFPVNISCFFLFIMLYASLAVGSADVMALITWQAGIAFTYCAIRAIKKILQLQPELGWIEEA